MKRLFAVFFVFLIFICSGVVVCASEQNEMFLEGLPIQFNQDDTGRASVIYQNVHYVPLRAIFETMGAKCYYKSNEQQILAITRDGDMIRHTVGDDVIIVNGVCKIFGVSSFLKDNETYVPIDMVIIALGVDSWSYDNQQVNIHKYLFHNHYHQIIQEVLDVSDSRYFYPEHFQRYINYHVKNPDYSMQEVLSRVNLDLDYGFYENITTIQNPYELLVLVNKYHQLPQGFEQQNLVSMDRKYTNGGTQFLLVDRAYEQYMKMSDAAKEDGISMYVVSAYRTQSHQNNLYNAKIRSNGKAYADNYSARAGHSEHQTGLAIDINSTHVSFQNSAAYQWLQEHAHEYGYILRYPKGKEWITGYAYEPWHYRYVGVDAAAVIHQEEITFEEYYAFYVLAREFQ